jgi:hypothetical protein
VTSRSPAWAPIRTASPWASQGRGVGPVEVAELADGHAVVDGRGGDVYSHGDLGVLVAMELGAWSKILPTLVPRLPRKRRSPPERVSPGDAAAR